MPCVLGALGRGPRLVTPTFRVVCIGRLDMAKFAQNGKRLANRPNGRHGGMSLGIHFFGDVMNSLMHVLYAVSMLVLMLVLILMLLHPGGGAQRPERSDGQLSRYAEQGELSAVVCARLRLPSALRPAGEFAIPLLPSCEVEWPITPSAWIGVVELVNCLLQISTLLSPPASELFFFDSSSCLTVTFFFSDHAT